MRAGARLQRRPSGGRAAAAAVAGGFALSRVVYALLGVRFDASPLLYYWQYVDPQLLRHDLASSLWHLHSQPPLFNLMTGLVLKAFGDDYAAGLHAAFLALGMALALGLFALVRRLGVGPWPAAALALLVAASPPTVLYENWFYAEYFVAAALVLAAVSVDRFAEHGRTRDAVAVFGLLAAVVLSRTFFHLAWIVGLVGLLLLLQPARRRTILVAAAVPVTLCVAVYAKNLVQYGTFSATTCSALNASRITTFQLDRKRLDELVREGKISRFSQHEPFSLPSVFPEVFAGERSRGSALLDRPRKSTGAPNLDHAAYLHICDRLLDDARASVGAEPSVLYRGIRQGVLVYWRPAGDYPLFSRRNHDATREVDRAYSIALGQVHRARPAEEGFAIASRLDEVAWLVVAGYLALAVLGARALLRARRDGTLGSPWATTLAFILANVLYVTIVGSVFEAGENNRFRFVVDGPAAAALAALAAAELRARRAGSPPA